MSDRLAISAAFSVLMMSAFVLFGPNAERAEFGPDALRSATALAAPSSLSAPVRISEPGASLISFD